jgi:hypothetical protein
MFLSLGAWMGAAEVDHAVAKVHAIPDEVEDRATPGSRADRNCDEEVDRR